jgi:hypothetical protein
MSIFEVIMLVCFGVSWPVSIAKTLRTKSVEGKSSVFLIIIGLGYASGIAHKWLYSRDWTTALYCVNLCMVVADIFLYYRFSKKNNGGRRGTSPSAA